MAGILRVSPFEAKELLDKGYVYVDVRSEPEFEQGHVPGAYNVPLRNQGPAGLVDNPDFLAVMQRGFAADERIIVGCRSGVRSMKAAQILLGAGYANLHDLRTGWEGTKDAFGRVEPGWSKVGLPIEEGAPEGRRYADVNQRRR